MKIFIISCLMIIAIPFFMEATTIDARFSVITNNGIDYIVKVQIKTDTGIDDLGSANFYFNFNNSNLSFPDLPVAGVDYSYQNFSGGNYFSASITKPQTNRIALNIELLIDNNGTVVTTDWMDVATINFVTTNSAGSSNLSWLSSTNQVVYDGDNSTFWTIGIFTNEDTSPLPVELSSFTASGNQNAVNLKWQTATEVNNYGFEVERSVISNEERNLSWQKVGFVNGNGNSNSPKTYSFSDNNPSGGSKFLYRLKQIDNDGQFEYSEAVEVMIIPMEYNLYQNYPNPFNPTTKIKFALPEAGKVVLKIYDMTGAEVAELVNTDYEAGYYDIELNASNLASGVYLYRLQSNNFTSVKKLVVLK